MSEDTAAPVDEANPEVKPGNETLPQDQEIQNKETELMMLEDERIEDEKMPSYMNATSISSSTKHEDSRNDNDEMTQPQFDTDEVQQEDDEEKNQGSGNERSNSSVVELSSGEESGRAEEDIEEEEEYSSDEMGYDDDEEDYIRRHEQYPDDDEDEESDGDIEADQFERSSDEYVYRSAPLESPVKERSRSLQDLSSPNRRAAKFNSRRQFQVMPVHLEMAGKASEFHLGGQRRASLAPVKYSYVPSKVKQYIEGIKEQNRLSAQRRSRERLDVNKELSNLIKRDQNLETDIRVNPQSRLLKTYAENNMKQMIAVGPTLPADMTEHRHFTENSAEIIAVDTGENMKKSYEAMAMEVDKENEIHEDEINRQQCEIRQNGLLLYSQSTETKGDVKEKDKEVAHHDELTNGTNDMLHVSSFQSVSYEDFIKGHFNDNQKTEKLSITKIENGTEGNQHNAVTQLHTSGTPKPLDIDQVKSLSEEVITTEKKNVDSEVSILKAQLTQTMVERDSMKEDYKMVVNENFQLKRELEELKKAFSQYKQEHKPKECKVAEVQTEAVPSVFDKSAVSHLKVPSNKLSASSITSAQSSEQWTDSNCSPSVSLKPPNVGSILNSDDSFYLGTPRKMDRPLSQAFYTSSRILQTLANITQGRSDPANPNIGVRRNAKGQLNEPISPLVLGDINSRKRKASDNSDASAVGIQQFKVPNLNKNDKRRKYNSNYETDDGDRATLDQSISSRDKSSQLSDGIKRDDDLTDTEEIKINDGIKCFVYKDDDNSKEKSFLLQAEDTRNVDSNGIVRECGPFLLANLEVRMSEANGTINIWGKEISRESTSEDVDEELEEDPTEANQLWPKTPTVRIKQNEFVCSTDKKFKQTVSHHVGAKAKISRQLNTLLNRPDGPVDDYVDRQFGSLPNLENHGVHNCLGCNHKQRLHSPIQKNPRIKNHSCCLHNAEVNNCDCEIIQTCVMGHHAGCRGVSISNPSNIHVKRTCPNYLQSEEICRHQGSTRLIAEPEDPCCCGRRRCNSVDISCNSRIENTCTRSRVHSVDGQSVFAGDNVPLIQSDRSSESGDNARRRLSGKRVRGILKDFLKSCGDSCYPQNKTMDTTLQDTNTNLAPEIRVTAPVQEPETPTCDKCGTSMADFQEQFEQLQADLEKIHSKSQALYKMMNTLRHLDSK